MVTRTLERLPPPLDPDPEGLGLTGLAAVGLEAGLMGLTRPRLLRVGVVVVAAAVVVVVAIIIIPSGGVGCFCDFVVRTMQLDAVLTTTTTTRATMVQQ